MPRFIMSNTRILRFFFPKIKKARKHASCFQLEHLHSLMAKLHWKVQKVLPNNYGHWCRRWFRMSGAEGWQWSLWGQGLGTMGARCRDSIAHALNDPTYRVYTGYIQGVYRQTLCSWSTRRPSRSKELHHQPACFCVCIDQKSLKGKHLAERTSNGNCLSEWGEE